MKTKRLFTALMMATMMSCGIILAQPGQKEKKLTPEQRIEMQVKKAQKRLFLDEETAAKLPVVQRVSGSYETMQAGSKAITAKEKRKN